MPAAIIAGIPPETDKRVQSAIRNNNPFPGDWNVSWIRAKNRVPGLSPSQIADVLQKAADLGGAHVLTFRGGEDAQIRTEIAQYFRFRWLESELLGMVPHEMADFFQRVNSVLEEELKWSATIRPQDPGSCLLLPECAFAAHNDVRHLWDAASHAGPDRIRGAAILIDRFKDRHYLPVKGKQWLHVEDGSRTWVDTGEKIFNHRGARHGIAPFPRSWKLSYNVPNGFHFDVQASRPQAFSIQAANGQRYEGAAGGHINMDAHGYVSH